MTTFKFIASIIGYSLLTAICIVGLTVASYVFNHYMPPWELLLALVPISFLLGLIITVAIDKPLDRPTYQQN